MKLLRVSSELGERGAEVGAPTPCPTERRCWRCRRAVENEVASLGHCRHGGREHDAQSDRFLVNYSSARSLWCTPSPLVGVCKVRSGEWGEGGKAREGVGRTAPMGTVNEEAMRGGLVASRRHDSKKERSVDSCACRACSDCTATAQR